MKIRIIAYIIKIFILRLNSEIKPIVEFFNPTKNLEFLSLIVRLE